MTPTVTTSATTGFPTIRSRRTVRFSRGGTTTPPLTCLSTGATSAGVSFRSTACRGLRTMSFTTPWLRCAVVTSFRCWWRRTLRSTSVRCLLPASIRLRTGYLGSLFPSVCVMWSAVTRPACATLSPTRIMVRRLSLRRTTPVCPSICQMRTSAGLFPARCISPTLSWATLLRRSSITRCRITWRRSRTRWFILWISPTG